MKRGRPPSSSLSPDIIIFCPKRCRSDAQHLGDRSCGECGSLLCFTCVRCGRVLSLANRSKGHRCALSEAPAQPPPSTPLAKKTFLLILRPGDSLAVVPPRLLQVLPKRFVRELVEENSIGEPLTEEYNLVMFHLHLLGHTVRFMARADWTELLYRNSPQDWHKKLGDVDVVLDGYWPYECANQHAQVRHHLDELSSVVPSLRICPSPSDTLFAAHKARYHAYLERTFEKRIVIPSVYLSAKCSTGTIKEALASLQAVADTNRGLALKRGLSGSARQVYFFDEQAHAVTVKQLHRVLHSADAADFATLWLLQPTLPEFQSRHELKLYFDVSGHLLVALASVFLPRKRRQHKTQENGDLEVIELRRDNPSQWLKHNVDEAIGLALQARRAILRVAPSLAPLMRIDVIRTERWGFLVNEVEHLGDTWLQLQRTSSADFAAAIARSLAQLGSE